MRDFSGGVWTIFLSIGLLLGSADAQEILEQWVLGVVGVSSSSESAGGPEQVYGPANSTCEITGGYTWDGDAWRPGTEDGGPEWIEMSYASPVYPFSIEVHESLNPGAVTNIFVRNPDGALHEVWSGEDPTRDCPGILKIDFPSLSFSTNTIRLELDTSLIPGWNQIDAVKLIGFSTGEIETFFIPVEEQALELSSAFQSYTFGDYDHDGYPDALGMDPSLYPGPPVLLHNEGDGTFKDRSSLFPVPHLHVNGGRIFGDYDNDGDRDLFVAIGSTTRSLGARDYLFRNDHGKFTEIAQEAGLSDSLISSDAIWLDYDRDGFLDLYVGHLDYPEANEANNSLYHNNGDGTFVEVTSATGLDVEWYTADSPHIGEGTSSGMVSADFNDDGWPDLYVSVEGWPSRLFFNDGRGHFYDATTSDVGGGSGVDVGPAVGDIDNDGDLDIFQPAVGWKTGSPYRSRLLLNLGEGQYLDVTEAVGLTALAEASVVFSRFFDFDNDGDLDLFTGIPLVMFVNNGDGTFSERTFQSGLSGLYSVGDYDDDGFIDVWFERFLFRNRGNDNHYLRVELVGTESNRDGIGARVYAATGNKVQTRELLGGDGISQDESIIHFGLGQHTRVDRLEIRWPSGQVDVLRDIPADQEIRVIEGRDEWYAAPRTVWEVPPPQEVTMGALSDITAVVRPTLFDKYSTITRITADLSSLGGPADLSLKDLGDGTYRLTADFTVGGTSDLRDVEVLIEQETSLGPYWINLSRNITIIGDPNTAVTEAYSDALPQSVTLDQNYPNPFNSDTVIRFALPTDEEVELAVFNLTGQQVATLAEGVRKAGAYTVHWDGCDDNGRELASGVYLYRLRSGQHVETRKLLLLQ